MIHVRPPLVLFVALASVACTLPSAAATKHRRVAAHRHRVATHAARPARPTWGYGAATTVYGASAPYYIQGPGGGDAYGYDPIGGPDHVGNGGPASNF